MKYKFILLVLFFTYLCHATPFEFAVKYSDIDPLEDELFDLIITNTGQKNEASNANYLGYVSLGEIEEKDRSLDHYKIIKKNPSWNSYIIDYTDVISMQVKKKKIFEVLEKDDGVFIDNIDSYYYFEKPPFKTSALNLKKLFADIRKKYPEKKIIINRGFEIIDEIADYIDGFLFENLIYMHDFKDDTLKKNPEFDKIKKTIQNIKKRHKDLNIYVIEYVYDKKGKLLESFQDDIYKQLDVKVFYSDIDLNHIRKYYLSDSEIFLTFYPEGNFFESPVHMFFQTVFEYFGKRIRFFTRPSQIKSPELYSGIIMYDDGSTGIYDQDILDFINKNEFKKKIFCGYYDDSLELFKKLDISLYGQPGRFVKTDFNGFEISPFIINSIFSFKDNKTKDLLFGRLQNNEYVGISDESTLITGSLPVVSTGLGRNAWLFDPFELFSKILSDDLPVPSLVIDSGNRIAYTHIDADGMDSTTDQKLNLEILSEKVCQRFDDIPFSVSFITSILDESVNPFAPKIIDSIRKDLYLENIEFASHSFSHPFVMKANTVNHEYGHNLNIPGYNMDFNKELNGSLNMLRSLFPEKTVNNYYWTGDCRPPEDVIKIADQNNIRCINGGDPEYSGKYSSLTFLSPFTCQVGSYTQYYANSRNEFIDTAGWKQDYHSFISRIAYFKNTARKRFLKPIDVYYHFYIVEKEAALNALVEIYEYLKETSLCNMFASDYLDRAYSFPDVRVFRRANDFLVYNENIKTLRVNKDTNIDIKKSNNIIGFRDMSDGRYLFLGDKKWTKIVKSDRNIFELSLYSSNIPIKDIKIDNEDIHIRISENYDFINPDIILKIGQRDKNIRNIYINAEKVSFKFREDEIEIK